jgi:lysozyme
VRLSLAVALVTLTLALAASPARAKCGVRHRLDGIDVSKYQGDIDWRRVKRAGIVFAFARVSDGLDVRDEYFEANWKAMKRVHIRRGAYQYFRASLDPLAQADLFVDAVHKAGRPDLPLVADVETDDGADPDTLQTNLQSWLERVEKRTRRRPIIYTSPAMGERLGGKFAAYPLWVAHYETECPRLPEGWRRWTFWQRNSHGRVKGIAGDVDLDHFAGTWKQLARLNRRLHRHEARAAKEADAAAK